MDEDPDIIFVEHMHKIQSVGFDAIAEIENINEDTDVALLLAKSLRVIKAQAICITELVEMHYEIKDHVRKVLNEMDPKKQKRR